MIFPISRFNLIQVICAFTLLSLSKDAQTQDRFDPILEEQISEVMLRYPHFNGNILVKVPGSDPLIRTYGFTSAEKTDYLDRYSRFHVGSLAKEIPSIALLDLISKDSLDFYTSVDQILPDLPAWSGLLTIEQLLFYKSGLPTLNLLKYNTNTAAYEALLNLEELNYVVKPSYKYNNNDNFLQALIVEVVTGQDFRSWIQSNYFEPLRMDGSIYTSNPPDDDRITTRAWSEVFGDDEQFNPNYKTFELNFAPLYLTIEDVYKWMSFVWSRILTSKEEDSTFFRATSLDQLGPLGILTTENDKVVSHQHGGIAYSYENLVYSHFDNGVAIILMTNYRIPGMLEQIKGEILSRI